MNASSLWHPREIFCLSCISEYAALIYIAFAVVSLSEVQRNLQMLNPFEVWLPYKFLLKKNIYISPSVSKAFFKQISPQPLCMECLWKIVLKNYGTALISSSSCTMAVVVVTSALELFCSRVPWGCTCTSVLYARHVFTQKVVGAWACYLKKYWHQANTKHWKGEDKWVYNCFGSSFYQRQSLVTVKMQDSRLLKRYLISFLSTQQYLNIFGFDSSNEDFVLGFHAFCSLWRQKTFAALAAVI